MATTGQLYSLGVHMGLASVQAAVAMGRKDSDDIGDPVNLAMSALNAAVVEENAINASLQPPLLEVMPYPRSDAFENLPRFYNNVVAFRTGITATLAKDSARASLVHAYDLGVNIAMAEAGATAGATTQQVLASLTAAKPDALALQLDTAGLDQCVVLLTDGTVEMSDLYTKILGVRSAFQALLP